MKYCVNKNGKPFANQSKVAIVEDDPEEELDESLIRNLNGFIRSVKDQEDLIDLNYI
jgi:hypothetical protein